MSATILVVDDEPDICLLVKRVLESEGYQISTAEDGAEALEKIHRERPKIVILDIILPKKDGFAVCQEVKADAALRDTIIIMFTVKVFDADRAEGIRVGADYYLTKPLAGRDLLALLREILGV